MKQTTLAGLLAAALIPVTAHAQTTWYVDDDNCPGPGSGTEGDPFCSIQDAIDAAVPDDIVLVAAGTYEPIDYDQKELAIIATEGPDMTSIVTLVPGHAVSCLLVAGPTARLEGFTITSSFNYGMWILDSVWGPIVVNCRFEDCRWGIYADGASYGPQIMDCAFINSQNQGIKSSFSNPIIMDTVFDGNGAGGLTAVNDNIGPHPELTRCTFTNNIGSGIQVTKATVTDCTFTDNHSGDSGGGVYGTVQLLRCTFSNNTALSNGGGAHILGVSDGTDSSVVDCVFTENTAQTGGGGGLFSSSGSPYPTLTGNVFCNNAPDAMQGELTVAANRLCPPPECPGDLNGDNTVGVEDFLALLAAWGPCP